MPVLYLVEQGATLRKDNLTFVVSKDDKVLQKVPTSKVEQVVLFGNINLTTPVIHYLLDQGIDCVFCSSTGRYHGRLFSTESRFGLLRQSQLQASLDKNLKLAVAKRMAMGKLANERTMLMRYNREKEDPNLSGAVAALEKGLKHLEEAGDVASVQGVEGYNSALYYSAFKGLLKQDLGFRARVRRPPRDPVNSLLSFGYTMLTYGVQAAVRTVGLDPFLGFLHSVEYSKPSLALDLMEEFRPIIVDSIVLRIVNNRILTAKDFQADEERGGMVRLTQDAVKTFVGQYEERVQTTVIDPGTNNSVSYRQIFELQARQIARIVTGKQQEYRPFLVK